MTLNRLLKRKNNWQKKTIRSPWKKNRLSRKLNKPSKKQKDKHVTRSALSHSTYSEMWILKIFLPKSMRKCYRLILLSSSRSMKKSTATRLPMKPKFSLCLTKTGNTLSSFYSARCSAVVLPYAGRFSIFSSFFHLILAVCTKIVNIL